MKKRIFIFLFLTLVFVIGLSISTQVSAKSSKGKSYKITYKLNKGTNNKKNPKRYKSSKSTKLYSPARTGYAFKGWYSDKKFTTRVKKIKKGTKGRVTLYAKWDAKKYKINYKLNKGINNSLNVKKYTYAKTVKLYPPSREGYVFKGWYTDSGFTESIAEIKKGTTTGTVTLYALWELEPVNINGTGNDDMIWSWWYYPQVISYEGSRKNLYWGFTNSEGYCGVASYNELTKATDKTLLNKSVAADDHNGLALTMMPDGRIMCVYTGGHNINNEIHIRISDISESIERFSTSIVLRSSGRTCYSQILQYSGKYYLFYRVNNLNWAYRVSSDGVNWTDEVILISSMIQYYCKFMPTTQDGTIRICMYSNPTSGDPNIRMGFFDLNTRVVYNADNRTKLGTDNISYSEFSVIINRLPGLTQRIFDVAITEPEKPRILYAAFSAGFMSKNSTYKLYDAGTVTDICQGGCPLWNPKYQLGASFIGTDKIVLAREEAGRDIIELYHYTEGNIEFQKSVYEEIIGDRCVRNARPIVDINGNAFLWHRGYYNPGSYKEFFTDAELYFMESE